MCFFRAVFILKAKIILDFSVFIKVPCGLLTGILGKKIQCLAAGNLVDFKQEACTLNSGVS